MNPENSPIDVGSKLLAVLGLTIVYLFILGGTILTLSAWILRSLLLLSVFVLSGCCQECRVSAQCKTIIYEVSFCAECIR